MINEQIQALGACNEILPWPASDVPPLAADADTIAECGTGEFTIEPACEG
jgi:hypothetical protein